MQNKFKIVKAQGHTFIFKYDPDDPEILHIYARHLTTIADALDVFFHASFTTWNAQHRRFESSTETHGLYWLWKDEAKKVVVIISCFNS